MLTGFRNVGAQIAVAIGLVVFSCSSMAFDLGNLFGANTRNFCERVQSTDVYKQYVKLTVDAVNGGYYSAKYESDLFDTNDKKLRTWMRSQLPDFFKIYGDGRISFKNGESQYLISDDALLTAQKCADEVLNTDFAYIFFRPDQLDYVRGKNYESRRRDTVYLFGDSERAVVNYPHWLALMYGGEQTLNETGAEFLKAYESELLASKKANEAKLAAQAQAAKQAEVEKIVKAEKSQLTNVEVAIIIVFGSVYLLLNFIASIKLPNIRGLFVYVPFDIGYGKDNALTDHDGKYFRYTLEVVLLALIIIAYLLFAPSLERLGNEGKLSTFELVKYLAILAFSLQLFYIIVVKLFAVLTECPHCHRPFAKKLVKEIDEVSQVYHKWDEGLRKNVTYKAGLIHSSYRCQACGEEWEETRSYDRVDN